MNKTEVMLMLDNDESIVDYQFDDVGLNAIAVCERKDPLIKIYNVRKINNNGSIFLGKKYVSETPVDRFDIGEFIDDVDNEFVF